MHRLCPCSKHLVELSLLKIRSAIMECKGFHVFEWEITTRQQEKHVLGNHQCVDTWNKKKNLV